MAEIEQSKVKIGKGAFLLSIGIILVLMIVSGILTKVLPAGEFDRIVQDGKTMVVNGSYHEIPAPHYPFWRWFTAPIEIIFAPGNIALITIILFIISVGGSINILEKAGVMEEMIYRLVKKFAKQKYLLISLVIFFFMFVSSFLGVYEGMVPMIIFIVPLAISLGWDSLTGLGISLLPMAFGFAAAVTNPFTIAVAQRISDLPLFSGAWLRIIFFLVVYLIVCLFVIRYAKKIAAHPERSATFLADEKLRSDMAARRKAETASDAETSARRGRALTWFAICVGVAMGLVFGTARIPGLSDLAFPVMGLLFLVGGIGAGFIAKLKGKQIVLTFLKGSLNLLPGIILILMAYSVKHIIVTGKIMDTILFGAANLIQGAKPMAASFLVYATTLVMNFFIGSASAKAFLMMPLLAPLADLVGITRQTAVMAFNFGDGFSNMIFPTNALLLIALSFTVVSYPKWMRWTLPLQAIMLLVTAGFLALAVAIRFGP